MAYTFASCWYNKFPDTAVIFVLQTYVELILSLYCQSFEMWGFWCATNFVHGDAKGCALKLCTPFMNAYTESLEFKREYWSKLIVKTACSINPSHLLIGKVFGSEASPTKKWFFEINLLLQLYFFCVALMVQVDTRFYIFLLLPWVHLRFHC